MCKVRSSTLLHSTIFFCQVFFVFCVGAAAQKTTTLLTTTAYIYSYNMRRRSERFFFSVLLRILFLRSLLFHSTILQYYDERATRIIITSIYFKYTVLVFTLLYLSRVVLFDVPVAQKRRHSERKVGWIFFYVKLEIFLQTFRLFLPGRVVFLQRNRTLRLVVVKQ